MIFVLLIVILQLPTWIIVCLDFTDFFSIRSSSISLIFVPLFFLVFRFFITVSVYPVSLFQITKTLNSNYYIPLPLLQSLLQFTVLFLGGCDCFGDSMSKFFVIVVCLYRPSSMDTCSSSKTFPYIWEFSSNRSFCMFEFSSFLSWPSTENESLLPPVFCYLV